MLRKEDVRFPAEGGIELAAQLFVPEEQNGQLPAITMAHGYADTRESSEQLASPGRAAAAFDERRAYELPEHLRLNQWALEGELTIGGENVVLEQASGTVAVRFHACAAHAIPSAQSPDPIPFRMLLDGEAPGGSRGVDVDEDGNGSLRAGRLRQLVREDGSVRQRTLEITFLEPGAGLYALTFG